MPKRTAYMQATGTNGGMVQKYGVCTVLTSHTLKYYHTVAVFSWKVPTNA